MKKKLLALLMALVLSSGILVSCTKEASDPQDTTTAAPSTGDGKIDLFADGISHYTVIYDADLSEGAKDSMDLILNRYKNAHGIALTVKSDKESAVVTATACEILLGNTNRPESKDASARVRKGEYILYYDTESTRVVINSYSNGDLGTALEYFLSHYADTAAKRISVPHDLFYLYYTDFSLQSLSVDGVDIREYRVVIPKGCDILTQYAAETLIDHVQSYAGITLSLAYDTAAEQDYEILIGDTRRTASHIGTTLSGSQYVLMKNGTKLVMKGSGVYTAAGVGAFVSSYLLPDAQNTLNRKVDITDLPSTVTVKNYTFASSYNNVILMIGDGMGYNSIGAALANGMSSFVAQSLPIAGEAITRSYSVMYDGAEWTDSAAAATALATGYKTINYTLGQDHLGNDVKNVRELATEYGAQTAIVTTDSLTGATPAAFMAHSENRNNDDVKSEITAAKASMEYCMGDVGSGLTAHTRKALTAVSDTADPFFVMIEEAHIDKRAHASDMSGVIEHVKQYNDTIAYVIAFTLCHPDTALIVTADHETGGIRQGNLNAEDQDGETYGYEFTSIESQTESSIRRAHTNQDVPLYALGAGVECFHGVDTENIDIARFIAKAYGADTFGQDWACPPVPSAA